MTDATTVTEQERYVRRYAAFFALKQQRRKAGEAGWNQSSFAKELGCSQSMVSYLLSGAERSPQLEEKFAKAFNQPVEFFFGPRSDDHE